MILERYILRSLGQPFLLGFGIITFLLTMDMLLDLLDLIIGKGIPVWTVARLFVLALGWIVALSVPCGVLVASLMTYGRMSQDNEITALRASGIHLMKILAPTLLVAGIVAVALTLFNNYILPETNYAYASLLSEITRKRPTAEIKEGVMVDDFRGYHLFIGRLDDRTGAMSDVLIVDAKDNPGSPRTILAKAGTLSFQPQLGTLMLDLRDGEIHEADPQSVDGQYRWLRFQSQTMNIIEAQDLWQKTSERRRGQREMSIPAMRAELTRISNDRKGVTDQLTESLGKLGLKGSEDLDALSPETRIQGGVAPLPNFMRKLLRPDSTKYESGTVRKFSDEERRWVELARSRQRELIALDRRANEYRVEIHKKFSIPVACIVFVLVGAPLGMLSRRGGLAAAFFSAVFFIFYYLCLIGGEQLADRRYLPPAVAMWLANIVLGVFGIYLTLRALRSGQPGRRSRGNEAH